MSKKYLIDAAAVLLAAKPGMTYEAHRALVESFASIFARVNPKFQRGRFMDASGVPMG